MTHKMARMLKPGDLVMRRHPAPISGEVMRCRFFGLTIKWSDGTRTKMLYRNMQDVTFIKFAEQE